MNFCDLLGEFSDDVGKVELADRGVSYDNIGGGIQGIEDSIDPVGYQVDYRAT